MLLILRHWVLEAVASIVVFAALLCGTQPASAQFSQQGSKLVGAGAVGAAFQGQSVALSADGSIAVVGGARDNANAGAAWAFNRSNGTWTQRRGNLIGSGATGAAQQGTSVALSAHGDTAVAGGPGDNSNTGAAWVFAQSLGALKQQGAKLVGSGAVGAAQQGTSVALSADGNTALVGGPFDHSFVGAVWVFTRSIGVWTQQGAKLVGTGAVGTPQQGFSVALSADGNTAIVGGPGDNANAGAAWVFTLSNGAWTQQGAKLVGIDATGAALQGLSVALSADGNTALVGGRADNSNHGAAWVFTRSNGAWTQQGAKLVGIDATGTAFQGVAVALSADGNTALVGGVGDNSNAGAAWVFARNNGAWTQQGAKLVGSGATGAARQGSSVALSGDAGTAIVGGHDDNSDAGAAWVFVQPTLQVTPAGNSIFVSGPQGGPFAPTSFQYQLSSTFGSPNFQITGIPFWLNADITSGTLSTAPTIVTFSLINVGLLTPGFYPGTVVFSNTSNGAGNTTSSADLEVDGNLTATPLSGVNPLTVTFSTLLAQGDANAYANAFTMSFGDGTPLETMRIDPSGIACTTTGPCFSGLASVSHTYTAPGGYQASLVNSARSVARTAITVTGPAPPVARHLPAPPLGQFGTDTAPLPHGAPVKSPLHRASGRMGLVKGNRNTNGPPDSSENE